MMLCLFCAQLGAAEQGNRNLPAALHPPAAAAEISERGYFDRPLIPTRGPTARENDEFVAALERFGERTVRDDFSSLTTFLAQNPDSPWSSALEAQLGDEYYRVGRYSKAIAAWKRVWESGKATGEDIAEAIGNRAGGELAMMLARLGRMGELRAIIEDLKKQKARGLDPQKLRGATEGLWSMEHQPEVSFRCGPLALDRVCLATDRRKAGNPLIQNSRSTTNGFSARQLAALSRQLGLDYQVAFRSPGAEQILPAVVHWKAGHYAAIVARDGELLRAEDPTFGTHKIWISGTALDEEASGYFLVRAGALPVGWRAVPDSEAGQVWGRGSTLKSYEDATTPYDQTTCGGDGRGMASWNVHLLLASHHVTDTPVGYTPPIGPPIFITASYNAVNGWPDFGLPYSNISQEWRLNWVAYLIDDPLNPYGDVRFAVDGGGSLTFTDFNSTNAVFQNLFYDRAKLVRTGTNRYEVIYPDGSKKIFDQPAPGVGTTRQIFMSAVVDPAGNAATIQYDQPGRITSVTDAIGQRTQFYYERPLTNEFIHPSVAWVPPYLVTRVVDPFGRTATFDYGSSINARLASIRDAIGMTSSFLYHYVPGQVDLGMTNLITPYGTTVFKRGSYLGLYRANWVEITHPNGEKERVEYSEKTPANVFSTDPLGIVPKGIPVRNFILWARNTYHWDRKAYAEGYAPFDYSKARIYHWTHGQDYNTASPILESFKAPLEHRIWFNYDGQLNATFVGTSDQPTKVARTVEDGTTQLYQFEYNSMRKPTRAIDPLGRELSFSYESNQIDLREIRQTRQGQNELLLSLTHDARHQPLVVSDMAGQTTRFGYNARGQVVAVTNALGHVKIFAYDTNGYLTAIDGLLPGTNDITRFTFDAVGRLHTARSVEGDLFTFEYDALDRLTRVTYPDGSYETIDYNRLDPEVLRDRAGRETRLTFDSVRQLTAVTDALGRVTRYNWCGCGGLASITDPLGRITSWTRDLQGRVQSRVRADGSMTVFRYDPATGWLSSIRDERNQVTKFDYNLDGTLRQKRFFNALLPTAAVKWTYDPNYVRALTREDGDGITTFGYHPITGNSFFGAGRLATVDGPLPNDTIVFQYDALGREAGRSINGVGVRRTWDAAGRLAEFTNILGTFGFTWDGVSPRLASMTFPNSQQSDFTYFPAAKDRLIQQITHLRPNASLLSRFTYDYDAARRITSWTQERSGSGPVTYQLGYNAIDQLTNVTTTPGGGELAYAYDAGENLTGETANVVARGFMVNPLNEVVAVTNEPASPRTYEWDAGDRLVAVNVGTRRSEFGYDGFGRRTRIVEKTNGVTVAERRYVWCGAELCEERDASGAAVLKRFEPFGVQVRPQPGAPAQDYFYTTDHLASIRELTDVQGQARAVYDYAPYGGRSRIAGDIDADFGFAGMFVHAESGLNLTLYRGYDARLARWLSRDPAGAVRANLFAYAGGNPVNLVDRLGLDESRPDLLEFSTGNDTLDSILGKVKSVWDKTSWSKKTTQPAEKFYDHVETGIEVYNDASRVSDLAGDCDLERLHDPNRTSWDELKNKGKEGAEIFKIMSKWLKKLTGDIPGSRAVTGPATELGDQILDSGVESIEESHGLFGGTTESGRMTQRILSGRDD